MGLLEKLLGGGEKRGSPAPTDDFWYESAGLYAAGVKVTPDTAMRLSSVYACVRVLAETVSSLPLILYKSTADGGKERATAHPLYEVLHDIPNDWQTSLEFREMMTAHVSLRGNAYAEILSGRRGAVDRLVPIHPDRVTPKRLSNGRIGYEVRGHDGNLRILLQSEMFHLRGLSFDGMKGLSPIEYQRNAVGLSIAAEEFGTKRLENGANPGGILEHPGTIKEEAAKRLRESWQKAYGGVKNTGKTAILEEGMKWTQVGLTSKDIQFIESRKFQVEEIARIFRIPPHMIGDLTRSTNNNIEHQSIDFVVHTIRPWLERWEQCISRDLLTEKDRKDGYFAEFLVDGLLRGDIASRYDAYAKGRQNGWLSANDIRKLENMNPVEGGDIYLVPLNMVPAEMAGQDIAPSSETKARDLDLRSLEDLRAVEAPEKRSMKLRIRVQRSHKRLFEEVATRLVKREASEVRKALKKYVSHRSVIDFQAWMRDFYVDFELIAYRQFLPVVQSVSEQIYAITADELATEATEAAAVMRFADDYAKTAAARYVIKSRNLMYRQLDAAPDEVEALVNVLLDDWEANRPEQIARRESVQSAGAIARESYKQLGVRQLRWVTNGDNCPLCSAMSGRIVGIEQNFMEKGDRLEADGAEPLITKRTIKHAPLHGGCDCSIVPA